MKVATKEEVSDYSRAIIIGGLKGAAVGLGVSLGIGYWSRLRPTFIRTLNPTFKTFFFISPILICGVTATEWASLDFDMKRYDFGEAEKNRLEEKNKLESLPLWERIKAQTSENKYKVIIGLWGASLGGSFWWINRDKFLTKSQKLVQARMYAQALTIVILLGSMILSVNSTTLPSKAKEEDKYSWQNIVAEEEAREKEAGLPLRLEK